MLGDLKFFYVISELFKNMSVIYCKFMKIIAITLGFILLFVVSTNAFAQNANNIDFFPYSFLDELDENELLVPDCHFIAVKVKPKKMSRHDLIPEILKSIENL